MTKANQKVKYSYICPKCKKFHDVTFNMNVTLCEIDIDNTYITLRGLETNSMCGSCEREMKKLEYEFAPYISAMAKMGTGIFEAVEGEFIPFNDESRVKHRCGSTVAKNFDISWVSLTTYPAIRIDLDNIDLGECGLSANFAESITDAIRLSKALDLDYGVYKVDELYNVKDVICKGNMKYNADLNKFKESVYKAIDDIDDNKYAILIRDRKFRHVPHFNRKGFSSRIHSFIVNFKDCLSIRYDRFNRDDIVKKAHILFGMQNSKMTVRLPRENINATIWQFDDFILSMTNEYNIVTIHDITSSDKMDKFIRYVNSIPGALVHVRNASCDLNFKELPLSSRRSLIREDLEYMKDIITIKEKENV